MLAAGMIVASKSPWCSPVRLVKKKDNSIRICVDFRKLNNVTIKYAYPIPVINDLFVHLSKAKVYSTLDLKCGYFQVKMAESSQDLTAFACQFGFFQYKVMPMGLTNACATFQRLMNHVLGDLIGNICAVYLDDIIIYSDNIEEHFKHIQMVCDRLRQHNLKISLKKCKFFQTRIEYLSHIIEDAKIMPNLKKVEAITKIKPPANLKQVQSFLGLASYYRRFVKNFSSVASPIIHLTEKNVPFNWSDDCEKAFVELKTMLISDRVLRLPDFDQEFTIETDASGVGLGGVLSQKHGNTYKPIAFFSKHLSKVERNYSTSERELLAIVLSVEYFKQYVYGRHFKIITDHQPLQYLLTADVPSPRLTRLHNRIISFDYEIKYRSGKLNTCADALSRIVNVSDDFIEELDINDEQEIVINAIHLKPEHLNKQQLSDENIKFIFGLKQLERSGKPKPVINDFNNETQRLLYKQWNRLFILNNNLYREFVNKTNDHVIYQYIVPKDQIKYILELCHDSKFAGHLGYEKTRDRIVDRFYWPNQLEDIKQYVKACQSCQRNKDPKHKNRAELTPLRPLRPLELVTTDILGPLPITKKRSQNVLAVIDHFTKYVEIFALKTMNAEEVADKLLQFCCRHSIPDAILSDQGSNYQSIRYS